MSSSATIASGVAGLGLLYVVAKLVRASSRLPLPPGPPKKFLIGNLLDMPAGYSWLQYHKWCKEYNSDIVHLDAAGSSIVLLDSEEAITELLDRRSAIYSSRSHLTLLIDLMGWTFNFAVLPNNDFWRSTRRLFVHEFSPSALPNYYPDQLTLTHELLRHLLQSPDDFMHHLRHWSGALIMSIAYGIKSKHENDPYLANAERTLVTLTDATVPGAFFVDSLPILKYVPEWMMSAGNFKEKARIWRGWAEDMAHKPFEEAKRNFASGVYHPSFTSRALEKMDLKADTKEYERIIEGTAMSMYVAASDTTVSAVANFILTMKSHPEVQKRAQAELEAAYGVGQLPDFSDFEADFDDFSNNARLPYVSACLKELLRHEPVTPFSIPHLSTKDDVYKGYFIPKGTTVIPNSWSVLHNEDLYGPNTGDFKPERFLLANGKLNAAVKDPKAFAFGFGRRICPGQQMAISSIWIAMTSILTTFRIAEVAGDVEDPTAKKYSGGLITYPLPFKAELTVRSEGIAASVRATEHNN